MVKQARAPSPEPVSAAGLLGWLFDMSFTRHHAAQVMRVVYWLVTAFYSLLALVGIVRLVQAGTPLEAAVGVILVIVAYVVALVVARIILEVLVVIFRMGEDLSAIRMTGAHPAGSPAYPAGQPYYMPIPTPSPPPAAAPEPVRPMASQPVQPANAMSLGPYLEETVGYGEQAGSNERSVGVEEPPPPSDGNSENGVSGYPPEADGPPWIT